MEALREATADLTVYMHPSNAADVRGAVARQLSTLLFSYEDRFDGVLLAHEVQFEGENEDKDKDGKQVIKAKILDGLVPYFGMPVTANLLLFSPQPEMILEGKVEMLCKESIHAIVLGVFSAAIMVDDIPETFKFKRRGGGKFISQSDKHHVIKKGSMIRFSVKRVDTEMNCHITGSLKTPHTGCMRWLSVRDAEYASEISSGKRKSRDNIKGELNVQDHPTVNLQGSVVNSERPRKSQKRIVEEQ